MYDLEQKITFGGIEFSMGQLIDMQKMTTALLDIRANNEYQKDYGIATAKIEASRAALQVYADSLGGELGERYSAAISDALDIKEENYQKSIDFKHYEIIRKKWMNLNWNIDVEGRQPWNERELAKIEGRLESFETWASRNSAAADLFKNTDTSSKDALNHSFKNQLSELEKMQSEYQSKYTAFQLESLQGHINSLLKQFGYQAEQKPNNDPFASYPPIKGLSQKA